MCISKLMAGAALATGITALVSFAPAAHATTYGFDVTTISNTVLDLNVTVSALDALGGYDITGVTGTVGGISVSTFTGTWGSNGDQISSGLYLNPHQGANPVYNDGNGPNVFTVQNPPGSGGWNAEIDNLFYPSLDPKLDYIGGITLLLSDGASYYVSANCSNPTSCPGSYYDVMGSPVITFNDTAPTPLPAALPLFATGLGALGLLGWRRKRKTQAAA